VIARGAVSTREASRELDDGCAFRGDWRSSYFTKERLRETLDRADRLRPLLDEGGSLPDLALRFICTTRPFHHDPGMRRVTTSMPTRAASGPPLAPERIAALRAHRWERDWRVP